MFPRFDDGAEYCLVVHALVKETADEVYDMLGKLHFQSFEMQR